MQLLVLARAFLALSVLSAVRAAASSAPLSADIFYWPLSAPQPARLAQVTYDPATLQSTVVSYSPPAEPLPASDAADLVRIGLYTAEQQWVGSLTSLAQLVSLRGTSPTLTLHLGPDNQPYHVALTPSPVTTITTTTSGAGEQQQQQQLPQVALVRADRALGPSPHLNKPVILGPDGKRPEEVQEKTLFQRYWYLLPILMFVLLGGGGGGEGR
ncbi:hypothetical protein VTO42DRAFT_8598 [Malbranchea cinnamomea]